VRVLLEFEDLAGLLDGRACAPAARGLPAGRALPRERRGSGVS
jgi:hypothetical protein